VLAPFAAQCTPEDAQLYYQIALHGRRDLPVCRDPRMGFEMTLLRMLAFRPASEADSPRAASAGPGRVESAVPRPAPRAAAVPAASPSKAPPVANGADAESAAPPSPQGRAEAAATPVGASWAAVLQNLDLRGPARQLADNCDLLSNSGGAWQLVLPSDKEHLNTQQLRTRLEGALRAVWARAAFDDRVR
jgi:DNA polymerase-3 subunit gamma/tau